VGNQPSGLKVRPPLFALPTKRARERPGRAKRKTVFHSPLMTAVYGKPFEFSTGEEAAETLKGLLAPRPLRTPFSSALPDRPRSVIFQVEAAACKRDDFGCAGQCAFRSAGAFLRSNVSPAEQLFFGNGLLSLSLWSRKWRGS